MQFLEHPAANRHRRHTSRQSTMTESPKKTRSLPKRRSPQQPCRRLPAEEGKSFLDALPRELRDAVYNLTFDHVVTHRREYNIDHWMYGRDDDVIFTFQAPSPTLRLVSRQFKAEYDERSESLSRNGTTLRISDCSEDIHREWLRACPRLATRCTKLQTTCTFVEDGIHAMRDMDARKSEMHFREARRLIHEMKNVEEAHIIFGLNFLYNFDTLAKIRTYFDWTCLRDVRLTLELRYLGMTATYTRPQDLCELNVPNVGILDAPATLIFWQHVGARVETHVWDPIRYVWDPIWYECIERTDGEAVEQRRQMESTVMEAWIAVHGCAFHESKKQWLKEE